MNDRQPLATLVARSAAIMCALAACLFSLRDFCPSDSGVAAR